MNQPLVYCVILNLNGGNLLYETIESVLQMSYPNFKIVVVDNGSTDGGCDFLRSDHPEIALIENGENLGFGGGNNIGIEYSLKDGAEWVFLLNNDIYVDQNLLSEMMKVAISDQNIGILCPKIYYHSESTKFWYAGGKINYFTGIIAHRGIREIDQGQYDQVENTDYVTGCAFLVKREIIEKVGMFDPIYHPIYVEDADWSVRAFRAGYRLVYVPQAKLWHKVSSFSGGGLTPFKTRLKVINTFTFFKRYAKWYQWLTIPFCIAGLAIIFIIKELFKGNLKIISALFQGFMNILRRKT